MMVIRKVKCSQCGHLHLTTDYWAIIHCDCGLSITRDEQAPMEHKVKRADEFLNRAREIMADRDMKYDKPEGERSMGKAVTAFNAITGQSLKESEGWLLLQLLKDVRQWQNPAFHADSAEDCVAYAALKAEALEQEQA